MRLHQLSIPNLSHRLLSLATKHNNAPACAFIVSLFLITPIHLQLSSIRMSLLQHGCQENRILCAELIHMLYPLSRRQVHVTRLFWLPWIKRSFIVQRCLGFTVSSRY
ncbi:hypothetical protein K492DRAFT_18932 [Lichtheimia hyalospora FSU 10163]|nr:hypothetical protein K492DRAFT_18932 [Lichtheimia hyalospora FSU 10163]